MVGIGGAWPSVREMPTRPREIDHGPPHESTAASEIQSCDVQPSSEDAASAILAENSEGALFDAFDAAVAAIQDPTAGPPICPGWAGAGSERDRRVWSRPSELGRPAPVLPRLQRSASGPQLVRKRSNQTNASKPR